MSVPSSTRRHVRLPPGVSTRAAGGVNHRVWLPGRLGRMAGGGSPLYRLAAAAPPGEPPLRPGPGPPAARAGPRDRPRRQGRLGRGRAPSLPGPPATIRSKNMAQYSVSSHPTVTRPFRQAAQWTPEQSLQLVMRRHEPGLLRGNIVDGTVDCRRSSCCC